eukprot:UN02478
MLNKIIIREVGSDGKLTKHKGELSIWGENMLREGEYFEFYNCGTTTYTPIEGQISFTLNQSSGLKLKILSPEKICDNEIILTQNKRSIRRKFLQFGIKENVKNVSSMNKDFKSKILFDCMGVIVHIGHRGSPSLNKFETKIFLFDFTKGIICILIKEHNGIRHLSNQVKIGDIYTCLNLELQRYDSKFNVYTACTAVYSQLSHRNGIISCYSDIFKK